MLQAHGITMLVDVRTVPRSRTNPQFNRETLPESLKSHGIEYQHAAALGGLRRPRPDSPNTGWKNDSFRGYADHMRTPEFRNALDALIGIAQKETAAIMCAEAVPWRCHRSLIADALTVRNVPVEHVTSATRRHPHKLTSFARVSNGEITYPRESLEFE